MTARAIWKGEIDVGRERLPVKFYSAVKEQGIHFRWLHASDNVPVEQAMVDAVTGEKVSGDDVQKALEMEEGTLVVLKPSEVATTETTASRAIQISEFYSDTAIPHSWFKRPYYLGPDGAEPSYFALAAALEATRRVGLAHWVMRKKSYNGALIGHRGILMIVTLRHSDEVLALANIEATPSSRRAPNELKLAEQLVAALESSFDPAAYKNEYRDRVMELVNAKSEGKTIRTQVPKKKPVMNSLEESLRSSLDAAKGRRAS